MQQRITLRCLILAGDCNLLANLFLRVPFPLGLMD